MSEIGIRTDTIEKLNPKIEEYKEIEAKDNYSFEWVREFWDNIFSEDSEESSESNEKDGAESDLEMILKEYFEDLKEKSECPETIPDKPFNLGDLKKRTPEENAEMREEFAEKRAQLKKEWEQANGREWPKYDHDVYSANGKLIRKAGSDYDAHHIQPLCMGGKNEASNITPLNAEVHYDKQGVHAQDSPYSKLEQALGGTD